ncbi:hypothetical protein [Cedecea neteri]|uniref:hypothetical protein n=1 Tax=Cedecea neteri TaxID=158822 RepID=UPI0009DD5998|nr:hypothetical protein [Cedecea neteri]
MNTPLLIDGMLGMGDTIYQRAFVKQLPAGTYIKTAWPELYEDLPVNPVRSCTTLRTQRKNEHRTKIEFLPPPSPRETKRIFYGPAELARGSIFDAMREQFGVNPAELDLPSFGPAQYTHKKPIAVIRPATVRAEWRSDSRNPDPDYLLQASRILRKNFCVISVADLQEGEEWLVGEAPECDLQLHAGELGIKELMRLVEHAAVVVTPVGWAIPAAIAYKTPVFVVAGGRGAHNAPEIVTAPEMDLRRVGWAIPENYCRCHEWNHQCDKRIVNFDSKFEAWLNEVVLSGIKQRAGIPS